MTELTLPHNWSPRPYQRPLWDFLEKGGKRAIAIWHRRAGKDDVALHWAACAAVQRPGSYWHLLPEYSQARKAIWHAVNAHSGIRRIDEAFPEELRANTNEQEMFIRLKNGSTWQVIGSDNYDTLVGTPPAGIVFSEWARAAPAAWAYLAPILAENSGWALFITTPVGRNHALNMLNMARANPSWFGEVLTVNDSGAIGPDASSSSASNTTPCSARTPATPSSSRNTTVHSRRPSWARSGPRSSTPPTGKDASPRWTSIAPAQSTPRGIWASMTAWPSGAFRSTTARLHIVDYYEGSGHGFDHYCQWLDDRGYHGARLAAR